ncbi:metallophosphoesterase family protein [Acuticoccus sp.]|uniref:metallophosphoesterase family protein n=1 Tax=Acuticoccus sp. TaxID=1904378 RepID=UPI003B52FEF5
MNIIARIFTRIFGGRAAPSTRFRLPEGRRVYAVGDIHGQIGALRALWGLVEDDLERRPSQAVTEVYLGDYVDRGPASADVVSALAARRPRGRRVVCLRGNHEDYVLAFLDRPFTLKGWVQNGAVSTLASYGVKVNPVSPDPIATHTALFQVIPREHLAFLSSLTRTHLMGDVLFVHAGIRPNVALERQTAEDLAMIRDDFLRYKGPLPYRVVHGHTPVREAEVTPYRVNVDTGAFATGRLSCAVLEGEDVRILSTPPTNAFG